MAVSKNRKDHKKKVAKRNQEIKTQKKRYDAMVNSYINSVLAKQAQEKIMDNTTLEAIPMTNEELQTENITEVEFKEV